MNTHDERDDLLKEIGRAIDVAPSREFHAKVRVAMEMPPVPAVWSLGRLAWAGGALGVVVVCAVVVRREAPTVVVSFPETVHETSVADVRVPEVAARVPSAAAAAPHTRANRRATTMVARAVSVGTMAASVGPDLTVVTDQPDVLRAMWRGITPRTPVVARGGTDALAEVTEVPAPSPIVIEPITVPPLVIAQLEIDGSGS